MPQVKELRDSQVGAPGFVLLKTQGRSWSSTHPNAEQDECLLKITSGNLLQEGSAGLDF